MKEGRKEGRREGTQICTSVGRRRRRRGKRCLNSPQLAPREEGAGFRDSHWRPHRPSPAAPWTTSSAAAAAKMRDALSVRQVFSPTFSSSGGKSRRGFANSEVNSSHSRYSPSAVSHKIAAGRSAFARGIALLGGVNKVRKLLKLHQML